MTSLSTDERNVQGWRRLLNQFHSSSLPNGVLVDRFAEALADAIVEVERLRSAPEPCGDYDLRAGISTALTMLAEEVDEHDDDSTPRNQYLEFLQHLMAHLNGVLMEARGPALDEAGRVAREPRDEPPCDHDAYTQCQPECADAKEAWRQRTAAAIATEQTSEPRAEHDLLHRFASAVASEEGPDYADVQAARRWMADEFHREERRAETKAAPEPDGRWQPIATAPIDGSRFLAYREGRHLFIAHAVEHGQMPFVDQMGLFRDPTHWMPLPAKPSPETKVENQRG